MHIGFFKSNKDLGFINPKGKTSIHSSDINIEDISWAIYLHTLIEPITHFPGLSLHCFTNSSTQSVQFLEHLFVIGKATKVSSEILTLQVPGYS